MVWEGGCPRLRGLGSALGGSECSCTIPSMLWKDVGTLGWAEGFICLKHLHCSVGWAAAWRCFVSVVAW